MPSAAELIARTLELVAAHAELSLHQEAVRKQETELTILRDRQRIATQLHDSVAQMLFTIGVAAHYARQQGDPAALTAALEEIENTAAQARSELRSSLHQLSQPAEGLAFEARLAGEARLFERVTGCRVKITGRGGRHDLPQPIEDLLIDTALGEPAGSADVARRPDPDRLGAGQAPQGPSQRALGGAPERTLKIQSRPVAWTALPRRSSW